MEKKTIITAREIFQEARAAFSAERNFICRAALIGIFLPLVVLSFALDLSGISAARNVRDSFFADASQVKEFTHYLEKVLPYFSLTFFVSVTIYLIIMGSYYFITARLTARARSQPTTGLLPLALKRAIPAAFAVMAALAVTSVLAQIAMFPAVFIICLSTMFPVLQFAEERGAFTALWHAITIRYARARGLSGWNVFLNLISIGAFCYTVFVLFIFMGEGLMTADTYIGIPRSIWFWTLPGTGLGLIYCIVSVLESLIVTIVLTALSLLTTSLYYKTRSQQVLAMA